MSLDTHIRQGDKIAEVHRENGDIGLKVFTKDLDKKDVLFVFAQNPDVGVEMNIDGSFGGVPEVIHNGTDTAAWTGSNITGAKVTFNSSGNPQAGSLSVKVNKPTAGNVWQFDKGSTLTVGSWIAFSMYINVTSGWTAGNEIIVYGYDTGTGLQVGDSVSLSNYFNELEFGLYHKISIPFTDMNLAADIDAIRMECTAKSGGGIVCDIDTMQVEQTSGRTTFRITAPSGTKYFATEVRFTYIDALSTTQADNSMPNLSYDQILGLTKLTNGIGFSRVRNGEIKFNALVKCLADSTRGGSEIINVYSDGTNTHVTVLTTFVAPVEIDSRNGDAIEITVNDDMTGLLSFITMTKGYTVDI